MKRFCFATFLAIVLLFGSASVSTVLAADPSRSSVHGNEVASMGGRSVSLAEYAGRKAHPLFVHLTSRESNPRFHGEITWIFNKFLLDRDGVVIDRYDTSVEPTDARVIRAVETVLADD